MALAADALEWSEDRIDKLLKFLDDVEVQAQREGMVDHIVLATRIRQIFQAA